MTLRRARGRVGAALVLVFLSGAAHAHSTFAGIGDFYAGVLHPLTALEHVLAFFAFGLLSGQHAERSRPVLPLFSLALLPGAVLALGGSGAAAVDLLNVFSLSLFGALIAVGRPLPMPVYGGLGVLFGATHGYANGLAIVPPVEWYAFIPGVGLAGLAVTAWGFVVADYLQRKNVGWLRIAVRVAGSWIAAIGLLVVATSWRQLAA